MLLVHAVLASVAISAVIEIDINGFAFEPFTVTVNAGDTVRWTNSDFIIHSVVSQTGPGTLVPSGVFDSGELDYDQHYEFTFQTAGTFDYYCGPHGSSMQGVIVVVPPSQCSADITGDSRVDTADLVSLLGQFGQSGPALAADLNDDATVNTLDLTILLGTFGCGA